MKLIDFRFLTGLFLFSCLITSNHFLILNEETIVAICFISFIIFSFHYFGKSVEESLDERNAAIKEEFLQALLLEQKYCQQIMYEHEHPMKKTGGYIFIAKTLLATKFQWYSFFRQKSLSNFFAKSLNSLIETKFVTRADQLEFSKKVFEDKWLALTAAVFQTSVLVALKAANSAKFQDLLLTQSISYIKETK